MTLLDQITQFVSSFEGFRSKPYQNPGDRPTIGYGTTFYIDGTAVSLADAELTKEQALELLEHFVSKCLAHIEALVTVELTDDQKIALTSFEYNTGHLHGSTLLQKLNAGDTHGASEEFLKWVHVGGVVSQGLMFRRMKEQTLFNEVV